MYLSAILLGLSRTMLQTTVLYATERHQFGVPIGSFQAVKHQLADAYLGVEFARPAVLAAAWALREGADPGPAVDGLRANSSMTLSMERPSRSTGTRSP